MQKNAFIGELLHCTFCVLLLQWFKVGGYYQSINPL